MKDPLVNKPADSEWLASKEKMATVGPMNVKQAWEDFCSRQAKEMSDFIKSHSAHSKDVHVDG